METDDGNNITRGGKKIPVIKRKDSFTAIIKKRKDKDAIYSMPGVIEAKEIHEGIMMVKVLSNKLNPNMDEFRGESHKGVCHHVYCKKDSPESEYIITDQIIVKFKPDISQKNIGGIFSREGVQPIKNYKDNCFLVEVTDDAKKNPIKVSNKLDSLKEVIYAEPNLVNEFEQSYQPTDQYFKEQWHLQSWNDTQLVKDADVSATEAWDITRGKRSVVVAIIDDGFDLNHPDFQGNEKVVHAKDYVDGDSNPFPVTQHGDYHGTPVAGVSIAEENGVGVVGVAPGCAFMPIRFPLSMTDTYLSELLTYVGEHADVISCSWGPRPGYRPLPTFLIEKFNEISTNGGPRNKGCVILFAAGNYDSSVYEPSKNIINGFTHHEKIMAISASTSENKKAVYSNWGVDISVCAPSNNFHPLDRNIVVPGWGIVTTDNEESGRGFTPDSKYTGRFGGTSSATPLVAGIAALVISANENLTADEVRKIIEETTDKIEDLNPDIITGHAKGTYNEKGFSEWFGFGKVNAAKAVQKAIQILESTTKTFDLKLKAEAKGKLSKTGDLKHYKITVGEDMMISLEGPNKSDFDVYLKKDSMASLEESDLEGLSLSSNEKILVKKIVPGEYYIMIHSYKGSGDYKLKVEFKD